MDYIEREKQIMLTFQQTIEEVIEYEKDDSYGKGHSDGMNAGIEGCIHACRKFGNSDAEIIEVLMEEYSLTNEEAMNKVMNK